MNTPLLRARDLQTLREIFGRFPAVTEVRLFGSRATGTARRTSDIDLAISAPDVSAEEWLDLCDALERLPLIYEMDVVRPDILANPSLKEKIAREGISIYADQKQV